MLWLTSISILLTADSEGVSGRQFTPLLPTLSSARLVQSGYTATTLGGRACRADRLEPLQRTLKAPAQRLETTSVWALRTPVSWVIAPRQSRALSKQLGFAGQWFAATLETWRGYAGAPIACVVLNSSQAARAPSLDQDLARWEIRWSAQAEYEGLGTLWEIARPIGDGARRLYRLEQLRKENPLRTWVSLGNLLEGWSWVRDGPSLHRATTLDSLQGKGPEYLVLGPADAVTPAATLAAELERLGSRTLNTFERTLRPDNMAARLVDSHQRLALIAQTDVGAPLAPSALSKRLDQVLERLTAEGTIDRVIFVARNVQTVAPLLNDPRIQLVVLPGGLSLKPRQGSFTIPTQAEAQRRRQPPAVVRIPSNGVTELALEGSQASLHVHLIDEETPQIEPIARRVNALRHQLYPQLTQELLPARPGGPYKPEHLIDLAAGVLLPAAHADALVLPPIRSMLPLLGGLSRLDLLARLSNPSPMVSLTVDGGALSAALKDQGLYWRSRERLTAGRPLRLVTTEAIAEQLKGRLGSRSRMRLHRDGERIIPSTSSSATLPRLLLPLLEARRSRNDQARLFELPAARQRAVLRIDRFQLSAFNQELRAPSAHRTLEDPRTNQPSRTSLGGHADLRLIQPIDRVELNLRGTAAYTRDLFGEDEGVAALDKESLDDWTLTAEIIRATGKVRPFTNALWDSEWTAGDPTTELDSPRQRRLELNIGVSVPKTGRLHEARLAATGSQDLTRALAADDPTPLEPLPGWRLAVTAQADWRHKAGDVQARLILDGRYYLPEVEPLPNTLLWAIGERLELDVPFAGGVRAAVVLAHTVWRTHDTSTPSPWGDHQFTAGLSLEFKRIMRPFAGIY